MLRASYIALRTQRALNTPPVDETTFVSPPSGSETWLDVLAVAAVRGVGGAASSPAPTWPSLFTWPGSGWKDSCALPAAVVRGGGAASSPAPTWPSFSHGQDQVGKTDADHVTNITTA